MHSFTDNVKQLLSRERLWRGEPSSGISGKANSKGARSFLSVQWKNGTRDERANALCFCARPTSTAKTHKIRIESSRVHFSYQPTLTGAGRTLLSIVHRP